MLRNRVLSGAHYTIIISILMMLVVALYAEKTVKQSILKSLQKIQSITGKKLLPNDSSLDSLLSLLAEQQTHIEENNKLIEANARFAAVGAVSAQFEHDIRNPMQIISIFLSDDTGDVELRAGAADAAKRVQRILNEMRNFSGSLKVRKDVLDLGDIAQIAINEFKRIHKTITVEAHWEERFAVMGDEVALMRIIINILNNAADAGSDRIQVCATQTRIADGTRAETTLSIKDWGSGVSPEHLSKLFQPFATFKKANGTGLGLWHASQVLKLMGGDIRILSPGSHGTGTECLITLKS
jgi:signal transduction histidine kinase